MTTASYIVCKRMPTLNVRYAIHRSKNQIEGHTPVMFHKEMAAAYDEKSHYATAASLFRRQAANLNSQISGPDNVGPRLAEEVSHFSSQPLVHIYNF